MFPVPWVNNRFWNVVVVECPQSPLLHGGSGMRRHGIQTPRILGYDHPSPGKTARALHSAPLWNKIVFLWKSSVGRKWSRSCPRDCLRPLGMQGMFRQSIWSHQEVPAFPLDLTGQRDSYSVGVSSDQVMRKRTRHQLCGEGVSSLALTLESCERCTRG